MARAGLADTQKPRIAEARAKRGMAQGKLASLLGLGRDHLACMEAGFSTCRLDVALRMVDVLDIELRLLFPGAAQALAKAGLETRIEELSDDQLSTIADLGIDADPHHWFVRIHLSGGQVVQLPMDSRDKRRLFDVMHRFSDETFYVGNSEDRRVMLNLDQVNACHFLYEREKAMSHSTEVKVDANELVLEVTFAGPACEPMRFTMDPGTRRAEKTSRGRRSFSSPRRPTTILTSSRT